MYTVCIEVNGERRHGRNRPSLKQAESTARNWYNGFLEHFAAHPLKGKTKWAVLVLDNHAVEIMRFEPSKKRKS